MSYVEAQQILDKQNTEMVMSYLREKGALSRDTATELDSDILKFSYNQIKDAPFIKSEGSKYWLNEDEYKSKIEKDKKTLKILITSFLGIAALPIFLITCILISIVIFVITIILTRM